MSSDSPDIDERILLTRVVYQQDMRALATLYLKYHHQIKSYIASELAPLHIRKTWPMKYLFNYVPAKAIMTAALT